MISNLVLRFDSEHFIYDIFINKECSVSMSYINNIHVYIHTHTRKMISIIKYVSHNYDCHLSW